MALIGTFKPRGSATNSTWSNTLAGGEFNYNGYFDVFTDNIANTNADDYFFPIAFSLGDNRPAERVWIGRYYSLTPAPPQRNVSTAHYGGCALDLLGTSGGWDAGSNLLATRQVYNVYHTLIGPISLNNAGNYNTVVYLRGGYRYYWWATSDIASSTGAGGGYGDRASGADAMVYGTMSGTEGDTTSGHMPGGYHEKLVFHESNLSGAAAGRTVYNGSW